MKIVSSPFSFTLSKYLSMRYLLTLLYFLGGLLAFIYLLDMVELLRRAGKQQDVPLFVVLKMGLFKLPEVGQVILPFAILFSGIYTFWSLTKQYELAVIRSAGLSVWQFLLPILMIGFLFGVVHITLVNPLSSILIDRFEQYETKYLGSQGKLVSIFQNGFWIREKETNAGEVILHAQKINPQNWQLQNVMGLSFNQNDSHTSRLDASTAKLEDGFWIFEDVHITQKGLENQTREIYKLPTKLTKNDIEESFSNPETVSFWNMPSFIKTLEATGFDSTELKIHYHQLLALPLMFVSMILLAAAVSFQPPRSSYTFIMIISGIILGILIFFLSSYLKALGSSGQISAPLAAWAPAIITFLLGSTALLTLEDG